jgi:hypothetical protein
LLQPSRYLSSLKQLKTQVQIPLLHPSMALPRTDWTEFLYTWPVSSYISVAFKESTEPP